jgi:putative nucleotidyltransferase with HDIG domain
MTGKERSEGRERRPDRRTERRTERRGEGDGERRAHTRSEVVSRATGGAPGLWERWTTRVRGAWQAGLERPWLGLVFFLVLGVAVLTPTDPRASLAGAEAVAGQIATRDYVAPVDLPVEDRALTEERRRKAREDVLPVYNFDSQAGVEAEERVSALFVAGRALGGVAGAGPSGEGAPPEEEFLSALQEATELKLAPEAARLFLRRGFDEGLEERLRGVLSDLLRTGVVGNLPLLLENRNRGITRLDLQTGAEQRQLDLFEYLAYPEDVEERLTSEVRRWSDLSSRQRRTVMAFLLANVAPNLSPNTSETQARREGAAQEAGPVYAQIRKGQVIARKGDQISPAAAEAIQALARDRGGHRVVPMLGDVLLLLLASLVLWLALKGEKVAGHGRERLLTEGLLLLTLGLLAARLGLVVAEALAAAGGAPPFDTVTGYRYAVPYAVLAVVGALLLGRNLALLLALLQALLVGWMVPEGALELVVFAMGSSLAAIYATEWYQFKQRLVTVRIGAVIGLANAVLALILTAMAEGARPTTLALAFDLLCAFAGGLLVAAAVSFSLPVLEALFGITTDITLVELANTNLPALRRLAYEAPGTFQHSLMVANLAKEGCEAIDSDPVLAYAAGLYHDLGKICRPEYFIENQLPGQNRHDKIQPSMSALILISHVKDGLELADRYNLPPVIRDAIAQHHGTRLISYFYNRAVERSGDPKEGNRESIREDDYRYPGPRPQNRVMGVLMLADGVEAASRTLENPGPVKIRELVRKIIDDCLQDRQLDESDLTLSDIRAVSQAFQRVLTNIHHRRVDYPGFEFNREEREHPEPREGRGERSGGAPRRVEAS